MTPPLMFAPYTTISCGRPAPLLFPNWVKSTGHSERFAKAYWEKTRGCLVLGEMPLIFKELIIFVVSVENGSRYCTACHAHAALQLDKSLTYEDMLAMVGDVDSPNLPLATRVALKFARKMAREANEVTDADFAEMRSAGYSDDQIKEILEHHRSGDDVQLLHQGPATAARRRLSSDHRQELIWRGLE